MTQTSTQDWLSWYRAIADCLCRSFSHVIFSVFFWQDPRWISSSMEGYKDDRLTFQLDGVSWICIIYLQYFWTIDCQITVSIPAWFVFCLLMFIMTRCTCLSRIQRDFAPNELRGKLCFFRPKPCTRESQQAEPDKYHWVINVKPSCFTIGLSFWKDAICKGCTSWIKDEAFSMETIGAVAAQGAIEFLIAFASSSIPVETRRL